MQNATGGGAIWFDSVVIEISFYKKYFFRVKQRKREEKRREKEKNGKKKRKTFLLNKQKNIHLTIQAMHYKNTILPTLPVRWFFGKPTDPDYHDDVLIIHTEVVSGKYK